MTGKEIAAYIKAKEDKRKASLKTLIVSLDIASELENKENKALAMTQEERRDMERLAW